MSKRSDDGIMDPDDPAAGGERDVSQVAQRHYDPDGNGVELYLDTREERDVEAWKGRNERFDPFALPGTTDPA